MQARDVWQRYWGLPTNSKAGIGCLVLFLVFGAVVYIGKTIQEARGGGPRAAVTAVAEQGRPVLVGTSSAVTASSGTVEPPRRPGTRRPDGLGFVTKKGYLAGRSKEALDRAVGYLAQNDAAAFDQILASGAVFALPEGIEVVAVDADGIFSGVVKVRRRGSTEEFWTVKEALEQ